MEILCFFAGIAIVYTQSFYSLVLLISALVLQPSYRLILWFLMAVLWAVIHFWWVFDSQMPPSAVLPKAKVEGTVVSLPTNEFSRTQFVFAVEKLDGKKVKTIASIACYKSCPRFKVGQRWELMVKLKKPKNLGNPGHFDAVGRFNANHIHWTGYIKQAKFLSQSSGWQETIEKLRGQLALSLTQSLAHSSSIAIVQALTLGIADRIDKKLWELFRRTGTTHLMVISGSHIGLIIGLGYWLGSWLWSRSSRCCLFLPSPKLGAIVGLILGFAYALLAGFAPPCQRSLIAGFFLLLGHFFSQRFTLWQAWRYGLIAVLIYEPHVVLIPGFYLSFLAVAILMLMNQLIFNQRIKKEIGTQLACLFGLMPLSLYWFSYGAVNGLFANLIAIPIVGFLIVPLSLIHLVLAYGFKWYFLASFLQWLIEFLLSFLHKVDSLSWLNLELSFSSFLEPFSLMLAMFFLLFLPLRSFFPAIFVLVFASFFPAYSRLKSFEVKIDVLDVGQGLAVAIHTAHHLLIYDTGMKFYRGSDMAKLAIIPYLNHYRIKQIDKIVISHPDIDHRGGLASLKQKFKNAELIVDKVSFYHGGKSCHRYPSWKWDGVNFRFLAIDKKFRTKNNSSCVLQIENEAGQVLLTGDIERLAESYLVSSYPSQLKSTVLLVPHHGSKTSSSLPFIRQVAPTFAIISSGFDNRYHFPHPQTLNLLRKEKIFIYNTADCGMVSVLLKKNQISPGCYTNNALFQFLLTNK